MRPRPNNPSETSATASEPALEVSDAVLARLAAGEIAALEELFHQYGARVHSVCLGILGNASDAEDATQEVFLRAFQQAGKFSGRSRFSTWLLRLAFHHTLNLAKASGRRRRFAEPLTDEHVCEAPAPDHRMQAQERRALLANLLQELPLEQRQVLVLRELEGLSYMEIGDVLEIPMGTVTSRLIRGRERLRQLLEESETNFTHPG